MFGKTAEYIPVNRANNALWVYLDAIQVIGGKGGGRLGADLRYQVVLYHMAATL
jgi:hypothetical protein